MNMPSNGENLLEPILEAGEIQGNILGGFNKDHQAIIPFRMPDDLEALPAVCAWLAALLPNITWLPEIVDYKRRLKRRTKAEGREPNDMSALWTSVAFSFRGLLRLTPEAEAFKDVAFRNGMDAAASARLGDPLSPDAPGNIRNWVLGRPGVEPDLLLILAGDDPDEVQRTAKVMIERASAAGLAPLHWDLGHDLTFYNGDQLHFESGREHFGFKDGISQPGVRGRMSERLDDFLTPRADVQSPNVNVPEVGQGGQPLVAAGQFVLGYGRQNQTFPRRALAPIRLGSAEDPNALAPAWARNGSFLVYRRLRQDVPAFNRFLEASVKSLAGHSQFGGMSPAALGALLVGRWQSGAPVLRAQQTDNPELGRTSPANNTFGYGNAIDPGDGFGPIPADEEGAICPIAAHIRKVNPRDLRTDIGQASRTLVHQLLRRGIPYGRPLALGATEDPQQEDRGLLFLSYQASLADQFEFLANSWMNDTRNPADIEGGTDMIVGQRGGGERFCLLKSQNGPVTISTADLLDRDWVIPTGGGYFFAPSRSALQEVLIPG